MGCTGYSEVPKQSLVLVLRSSHRMLTALKLQTAYCQSLAATRSAPCHNTLGSIVVPHSTFLAYSSQKQNTPLQTVMQTSALRHHVRYDPHVDLVCNHPWLLATAAHYAISRQISTAAEPSACGLGGRCSTRHRLFSPSCASSVQQPPPGPGYNNHSTSQMPPGPVFIAQRLGETWPQLPLCIMHLGRCIMLLHSPYPYQ